LLITSSIEKKTISPILPKFLILINSKPATLTHFIITEFEHSNTSNQHKKCNFAMEKARIEKIPKPDSSVNPV
jgi:hypothetical protein